MRGSIFGKMLSITSFGESHGPALGVVIDGMPAGLEFSLEDLQSELNRRAPGSSKGVTARKEADKAIVLSGIFEDKTLGTPIAVIVENTNQRSKDYDKLKSENRPGHADETYNLKYGFRDHRGGGRSSGRETLARVIGGYFAGLILNDVNVRGFVSKIDKFEFKDIPTDLSKPFTPYGLPDQSQNDSFEKYMIELKKNGDSRGGDIKIIVDNCPVGLGEPSFDKLKADLAKGLMSIGATFAFGFGLGHEMANIDGVEVSKNRDNYGGIEGGISNGRRISISLTFKPTSTVGEKAKEGRHDPCIIPRAIVVAESMVKLVLADHYLRQRAYSGLGTEK